MPNKQAHDKAIVICAGVYSVGCALMGAPAEAFIPVAGMLRGVFLTPDLDLAENNNGDDIHAVFRTGWERYGKSRKHRGMSHTHVIGTLDRIRYSAPFWLPVQVLAFRALDIKFQWVYIFYWFLYVLGRIMADSIHILLDKIVSGAKKALKTTPLPLTDYRYRRF